MVGLKRKKTRVFNQVKLTSSPSETFNLGLVLAEKLRPNTCILLSGLLGAGKTQLIKGFCQFFGFNPDLVQSPTYSLHHTYQASCALHHLDLYRLKDTQDFIDRGFIDILETKEPIFIEWPTQVDSSLFKAKDCLVIDIEILTNNQRKFQISYD